MKIINTKLLLLLLLTICLSVSSQTNDRYFIQLTDKNNSVYSLSNPIQFLSQRAIDRRTRQNIAIDSTDLPVNSSYVMQIQNSGATVLYTSKWFNAVVATIPNSTVLSTINALPFVVSSNPVNRIKSSMTDEITVPLESAERINSASSFNYGASQNQVEMLNGICMHDQGYNGAGMQIAILDGGFAYVDTHTAFDSLWANGQILGTRDFTFYSPSSLFSNTTSGHGTSVLSCIGGNVPGQLIGTAPKASFWLFRSEYVNSEYIIEEYNWVGAAEAADSAGADIINSSLGYNTFDNSLQNHSLSDLNGQVSYASRAATMCARKGMIVCNSAGNTGGSGWPKITIPGDADSILTVGAVDANQNYASFSSIGPTADGRMKPDVCAQGLATVLAVGANSVSTSSGTSFSSPLTAGMVACLWQANPNKTNMEIIDAIRRSSSLYNNPNYQLGYGIPDYCAAHNMLLGLTDYAANSFSLSSANPFSDEIKFKLVTKEKFNLKIHIYDITGKLIFSENDDIKAKNYGEYAINTVNFAAGIYIMKITGFSGSNEQSWQYKLLKVQN